MELPPVRRSAPAATEAVTMSSMRWRCLSEMIGEY